MCLECGCVRLESGKPELATNTGHVICSVIIILFHTQSILETSDLCVSENNFVRIAQVSHFVTNFFIQVISRDINAFVLFVNVCGSDQLLWF